MLNFEITNEGLKISITDKAEFLETCKLSFDDETGEYIHGEFVPTCAILDSIGLIGNGWDIIEDEIALYSGEVICYDAYRDTDGEFLNFGYDSFYDPYYQLSFWYERLANSKEEFIILPRLECNNIEDELRNMKAKKRGGIDGLPSAVSYWLGALRFEVTNNEFPVMCLNCDTLETFEANDMKGLLNWIYTEHYYKEDEI